MKRLVAMMMCAVSLGVAAQTPCVDPFACNFTEFGECEFLDDNGMPCVTEGCAIDGACNFDPEADINDGSCEFTSCLGCTDQAACNYDSEAVYLDLSCIYYVDCNGVCGGDWIEDECGNCLMNISQQDSTHFVYTGTPQSFIVPSGVSVLMVEVWGAQGGSGGPTSGSGNEGGGNGGFGGGASGYLDVSPGEELLIYVGGEGPSQTQSIPFGGWNGGGGTAAGSDDGHRPGCGGGATDIRLNFELSSRVIVAGGGGGASGWMPASGGAGGGLSGASGQGPYYNNNSGGGGTQFGGGAGGSGDGHGTLGLGGRGLGGSHGGGGGGGGYYGGGGGWVDSGGGGSSFIGGVTLGETQEGLREGNGFVKIIWLASAPECVPGCANSYACNFNADATYDDGSCDFCFCGYGTIWDLDLQQCIVANPSDSNFDGCVQLNDLLDLLSAYGDCGAEESAWQCGDPLEYQGYDYETVQIGEQCWFAENLRVENYRNGDAIDVDLDNASWGSTSAGASTVYGQAAGSITYDGSDIWEDNLDVFGRLYNGWVVTDERKICPSGWGIPDTGQWEQLVATANSIGLSYDVLRSTITWNNVNGTNDLGFSALAGGRRRVSGNYNAMGNIGYWWHSADEIPANNNLDQILINPNGSGLTTEGNPVWQGVSIRCIKD